MTFSRSCSLLLLLGVGCTSPTVSLATRKLPDAGNLADADHDDDSDGEDEHEDDDEECESLFRECEDPP
jgi:hypothetical protein